MPGFCKRLKVNDGVHIEGDGQTIDVVITRIFSGHWKKQVFFKVKGFEGIERFMLDYNSEDMEDIPHVKIGIAEKTNVRSDGTLRGRNVSLFCAVGDGYQIDPRQYPV